MSAETYFSFIVLFYEIFICANTESWFYGLTYPMIISYTFHLISIISNYAAAHNEMLKSLENWKLLFNLLLHSKIVYVR